MFYTGEYGVHIKYNGQHVPDSPTFVYIAPECGDARMVTVHGIRDRGLNVSMFGMTFLDVRMLTSRNLNFVRYAPATDLRTIYLNTINSNTQRR